MDILFSDPRKTIENLKYYTKLKYTLSMQNIELQMNVGTLNFLDSTAFPGQKKTPGELTPDAFFMYLIFIYCFSC